MAFPFRTLLLLTLWEAVIKQAFSVFFSVLGQSPTHVKNEIYEYINIIGSPNRTSTTAIHTNGQAEMQAGLWLAKFHIKCVIDACIMISNTCSMWWGIGGGEHSATRTLLKGV